MNSIFNKLILGVSALALCLASCKKPDNTNPAPSISDTSLVKNNASVLTGAKKDSVIITGTDTALVTFTISTSSSIRQIDFAFAGTGSYMLSNPSGGWIGTTTLTDASQIGANGGWFQQRGWINTVQKRDRFINDNKDEFTVKVYGVTDAFYATILVHDSNGLQNNVTRTVYRSKSLN